MASTRLLTFSDAIEVLNDFAAGYGGTPSPYAMRQIVADSYAEFASVRDWSYLRVNGRILLQKAVSTGTVVYTHATRTLTLTGATWPASIEDWCVRFDEVVCDVETRSSDTVVILDSTMNPGGDVASTTYLAYPRWYKLPGEFVSMNSPMANDTRWLGQYVDMSYMLSLDRFWEGAGDVKYYALGPAQDQYGYMALYVWPPSDTNETYDYIAKRSPRALRYSGRESAETTGTITVTAGSKTVAGSATAFSTLMEGSILRLGSSTTNAPTRLAGAYPYLEEHTIKSVTDATTLTLATAVTTSRAGVKYIVSDPVDIPPILHTAFLACAKKNLAFERNFKEYPRCVQVYDDLLFLAKCTDSPSSQSQIAGSVPVVVSRLADGTIGEEV